MRKVAPLLAPLLMGCAELLAGGTPGTPDGGAYCWRQDQTGRAACYPSQEQRDAAYQANEEGVRRAQAATLAAMALAEAQRQDAIRADQEQKAAAETEARQERQSKIAAFVAERDRKDAIKAEAAANVHALALDKQYAAPAISAIMCSIDDEVRGLRADLAHEKRVAAVGGVINLKARSEIATQLVDDSDELNGWNIAPIGSPPFFYWLRAGGRIDSNVPLPLRLVDRSAMRIAINISSTFELRQVSLLRAFSTASFTSSSVRSSRYAAAKAARCKASG
jgi:hypothetical protein